MARRYEKEIEKLRDQSDKESNKKALFQMYQSIPKKAKDDFVKELIFQFEEYIEKAHYLYINYYNEEF